MERIFGEKLYSVFHFEHIHYRRMVDRFTVYIERPITCHDFGHTLRPSEYLVTLASPNRSRNSPSPHLKRGAIQRLIYIRHDAIP